MKIDSEHTVRPLEMDKGAKSFMTNERFCKKKSVLNETRGVVMLKLM